MADEAGQRAVHPEVEAFVRRLIDQASLERIPELLAEDGPEAIYRIPNRQGISVAVLRTRQLSEDQFIKLMRYRLAQYLATGFVDAQMVYEAQMEHEPLANVLPDDFHAVAGCAQTGQILCYGVLRIVPEAPAGTTLRTRERPLFPSEKNHGWGVFNRLRLLPDLPIAKIRELGRFVKNQGWHLFDELGARAPVEACAAVLRALTGPLALEVDAVIGDLEEGVAKQNMDFFHTPSVVIHGTVPYEAEREYLFSRYQNTVVYPFAFLTSDLSEVRPRLQEIEQALELPAKKGLSALFVLKRDVRTIRSSLEPAEGLAPLATAHVAQRGTAMHVRREMLDVADRLRRIEVFQGLSVAEAAILGTLVERCEVEAGEVIIRQGELGDDLFVIETGQAEAHVRTATGQILRVSTLGPDDYFGEIALLSGGERTADVIAVTPMTLLRLSKEAYTRYLAAAADVEQHIARTAASRATETLRKLTGRLR